MITWKIEWMNVSTTPVEGFDQVVLTAGWRCNAVDGEVSATAYGSVGFPQPSVGGQFTPYDQLTEDVVLGWAWDNGVDKAEVETNLNNQLDSLLNPPVVTPPLPWSSE